MSELKNLFEVFGHLICSLDTDPIPYPWYNSYIQNATIDLIDSYCSKNEKLKSIKMTYFNNIGQSIVKLKSIFLNLQTLHLECVSLPYTIPQLLNLLPNVKTVILLRCLDISLPQEKTSLNTSQVEKLHLHCFEKLDV